ncbi:uncharacterized protein LOC118418270 [Branchiostoma floridae]|uniref:Uncharacterized protein LOC118418270 n=1 Tax=Branchiostoma floridae TaxID=7739 RepID=A0A9J7LBV9_BRAFL|nr:uncharacterized protein LOC118418270 [Branchiostoma floridae]
MAPRRKAASSAPAKKKQRKEAEVSESEDVVPEEHDGTKEEAQETQGKPNNLEYAIADFYESNKLFYDKGDPDYRNREKKRLLLQQFCSSLGMGTKPEDITRSFKSQRTEYVKLKRTNKAKSGSGKVSLTSLQRWKLERFQFLDPYCMDHLPEDLGSDDDGSEDGDQVPGTSTGGETPCGSSGQKRNNPANKKKKSTTSSSVSDILEKFLQASEKEKKRTQQEVKLCVSALSIFGLHCNIYTDNSTPFACYKINSDIDVHSSPGLDGKHRSRPAAFEREGFMEPLDDLHLFQDSPSPFSALPAGYLRGNPPMATQRTFGDERTPARTLSFPASTECAPPVKCTCPTNVRPFSRCTTEASNSLSWGGCPLPRKPHQLAL